MCPARIIKKNEDINIIPVNNLCKNDLTLRFGSWSAEFVGFSFSILVSGISVFS